MQTQSAQSYNYIIQFFAIFSENENREYFSFPWASLFKITKFLA